MLRYLAHAFHLPLSVTYIILLGATALAALALGLIVRRLLGRWARRLNQGWERLVAEAVELLAIPLVLVITLDIAIEVLELPPHYARTVHILILALTLGVVFYFLGKIIELILRNLFQSDAEFNPITQPATLFVRALLGFLALIIFLENIGVSLTAVWTTLGVGSVAIGLALQATLSNFFAGITLLADRPVSPGDHILLGPGPGGPGVEGEVVRIGWRATEVQIPTREIAFIPNSLMASTTVINYSVSGAGAAVSFPVKLNIASDVEKAEALLIAIAKDVIQQLKLTVDRPPEIVQTSDYTDPFAQLTLKVPIPGLMDREKVSNALRSEITARYRRGELKAP
jgi:small-conductance mechanosensitive channel